MSKTAHSGFIYHGESESSIWHMIIDAKIGYLHMVRCEYNDDTYDAKVFEIGDERYNDLSFPHEEGGYKTIQLLYPTLVTKRRNL